MIKRHLLFLGLLLSSTILCGQTFNKKYFKKTIWFSNNKDSTFYKSDTLKLIKYSTFAPEWASEASNRKEYAEFEMKYLNTGDYVEFGFNNSEKMYLLWHYNSMGKVPAGPWTWTFDKKTNIVSFYDVWKKLVFSFRPISEKQIKIQSKFAEHKDSLTTIELTVIRVK